MIWLRSALFNLYFYAVTAILAAAGIGFRLFARARTPILAQVWARLTLAGARRICGIRLEVSGTENLPGHGPALLACQHQSAFDTIVWFTLLPHPVYVMKMELMRIPLFGPLLRPAGMIPVDRQGGAAALRALLRHAGQAQAAGRQIVIFPEGTRVAPGERVELQAGIAAVSARLGMAVLPVATDSGLVWGRRAFRRTQGTIHIRIGPPIPPGVGRHKLLAAIEGSWRSMMPHASGIVDNPVEGFSRPLPGGVNDERQPY